MIGGGGCVQGHCTVRGVWRPSGPSPKTITAPIFCGFGIFTKTSLLWFFVDLWFLQKTSRLWFFVDFHKKTSLLWFFVDLGFSQKTSPLWFFVDFHKKHLCSDFLWIWDFYKKYHRSDFHKKHHCPNFFVDLGFLQKTSPLWFFVDLGFSPTSLWFFEERRPFGIFAHLQFFFQCIFNVFRMKTNISNILWIVQRIWAFD